MVLTKSLLLAGAYALAAFAAPVPEACDDDQTYHAVATSKLTAENLALIAPATATLCPGGTGECADNKRAATAINKGFEKWGIKTGGEQAALVAYMLFESGNFQYNHNVYPGRPGQGTRMMAMPPFVGKYADAIIAPTTLATARSAGGDAALNAVLGLVNADDEKSFGAAPWFLTTCDKSIRDELAKGSAEGWKSFLTVCVQTTMSPDRDAPWEAAKKYLM